MFIIKLLTIMSRPSYTTTRPTLSTVWLHHYRLYIFSNPVNCCHVLHYSAFGTKSQYGTLCAWLKLWRQYFMGVGGGGVMKTKNQCAKLTLRAYSLLWNCQTINSKMSHTNFYMKLLFQIKFSGCSEWTIQWCIWGNNVFI